MLIKPIALTLVQLLGSTNEQFIIPSYQRRYSWRKQQVWELLDDIHLIEGTDTHLLGSIVCLIGPHSPSLNELELVDGQQRLTTLCILLECLRERFVQLDQTDMVHDITRLLTARAFGGPSQPKIKLETLDADDFRSLAGSNSQNLDHPIGNRTLQEAFLRTREWLSGYADDELSHFTYKLLNQTIIVRLDVSDAKDAFKLFETINNRGLKLSATDLIKNFMLGNAARFGTSELEDAKKSWSKLTAYLDGADSDSFFRYFLISKLHTRLTMSGVVYQFQAYFMNEVAEASKLPDRHWYAYEEEWEDEEQVEDEGAGETTKPSLEPHPKMSFNEFLHQLVLASKAYGEILRAETGIPKIDRHLRHLRQIKSAQSYGYLMHLRTGGIDEKTFVKVLKLTENFILRRHVCRERANETESLFAHLCAVDPRNPLEDTIIAYREACPVDEKFRDEFRVAQFTSNILERARYCLEQLELSKHGDHLELGILGTDAVHVEHIIPKQIKSKRAKTNSAIGQHTSANVL